jgi:queuine tRNA-ribosyltransferase
MSAFEVTGRDSRCRARRGIIHTPHGDVQTPVFMPVGTRGAVKGITPDRLEEVGASIILANTYHMMLRPGVDIVEKIGGLHNLMAWPHPILTDSGGYQIFSLSTLNRIGQDGVEFASHIDGRRIYIDPKIATEVQNRLGPDIFMCFDECTPYPCEAKRLQEAVERTIRWAKICRETHANPRQLIFGIVQGGTDVDLRSHCAGELVQLDFDGYAIGGLSVGEGHENMVRVVTHTAPLLPEEKPRYLMGVGTPADIIASVRAGIDMFDCVLPTRNGRNAYAFTAAGPLRLRNNTHSDDTSPIEAGCDCYACRTYNRCAIRHFFNVGEMLGPVLVSIHNLRFYQRLMAKIRRMVETDAFDGWAERQLAGGELDLAV